MTQGTNENLAVRFPYRTPGVYLVSDDTPSRGQLAASLTREGFDVSTFANAASFYRAFSAAPCELVVIDVLLDGANGLSIAEHLRRHLDIGIVMLSESNALEKRLKGFESGADAWLVKPVDARELSAQLRVVQRRLSAARKVAVMPAAAGWALEQGAWELRDPQGNVLSLTTAEREFFLRMLRVPGETVSRSDLIACLGSDPERADPHRIDVLVNRIRRKAAALNMDLPLHSVRGKGYVMATGSKPIGLMNRLLPSARMGAAISQATDA